MNILRNKAEAQENSDVRTVFYTSRRFSND